MLLIEIEGKTNDKEAMVNHAFKENNVLIRRHGIDDIKESLNDKDIDSITVASVVFKDYDEDVFYNMDLDRTNWKTFLEGSRESLEAQEEYEMCSEIRDLLKEMKKKNSIINARCYGFNQVRFII